MSSLNEFNYENRIKNPLKNELHHLFNKRVDFGDNRADLSDNRVALALG
jgi:hypothetical protein